MSVELILWGYLLVTLAFGIPYSVATFKLSDPESFKVSDYIMVSVMSSLLWPIVLGYNLTHRQAIRDEKRKRVHSRNAKLLTVQLENHKAAMKERKARHARALNDFDLEFPQKKLEPPARRAIHGGGLAAQDKFIQQVMKTTPIHYDIGPCDMRSGQKDFLRTNDLDQITCQACKDWVREDRY